MNNYSVPASLCVWAESEEAALDKAKQIERQIEFNSDNTYLVVSEDEAILMEEDVE
jgi:hypothetical protein